jgi:hypothetical protein
LLAKDAVVELTDMAPIERAAKALGVRCLPNIKLGERGVIIRAATPDGFAECRFKHCTMFVDEATIEANRSARTRQAHYAKGSLSRCFPSFERGRVIEKEAYEPSVEAHAMR